MKINIDPAMTITITNTVCNYDWYHDRMSNNSSVVSKHRKNGFVTKDSAGKDVGIVFPLDDIRSPDFGAAAILFFKKYQAKYGVTRVISIRDSQFKLLPYDTIAKALEKKPTYTVTTASRVRTN